MRKTLALTLCAALAAGTLPAPAAAQLAVSGARTAGTAVAPVVVPMAPLGGANLISPTASLTSLAPTLPTTPLPVLSAPSAAAQASASVPTQAVPSAQAVLPARSAASAAPAQAARAASVQAPGTPAAAVAQTLKAVRESGTDSEAAPLAGMSPAAAAQVSGRLFDNGALRSDNGVRAPAVVTRPLSAGMRLAKRALAVSPLGRLLPAQTAQDWGRAPPAPRTAFSSDEFGGPQPLKPAASEGGRLRRAAAWLGRDLAYGAKWALTLFGLSGLLQITVKPLAAMVPWVESIPHGLMGAFGRFELLAGFGPYEIAQGVAEAPLTFLGLAVPGAVLMEELTYRLASFGLSFLLLSAVRPAAQGLAAFLDKVPDLFGVRSAAQWALRKAAAVSGLAFPLAASYSAYAFAAAHFAAWGVAPFTLALHLSLGLALAWTAYRSRGLVAPFTAHLGYNLLSIAVGVAAPLLMLPQAAALTAVLAGVFAASFAYYQWRSWKKDKAAALDAALGRTAPAPASLWARARRIATAALVPVVLAAGFGSALNRAPAPVPSLPAAAAPAAAAPAAPAPAKAAVRPTLSTEDLVKAVKPATVMVLVGNGLGSGFIISPDGLLVTNAHVVAGGGKEDPLATDYARVVKIRFANGMEVPARVVGYHPTKDLALIQLPPNPFGWPTVPIGDSSALAEGEAIVAAGHPRGLPFTVTRGIVSGVEFRSNGWVKYIQHDASVNPGNSGGPLFNMRGEVVGVNSMIMTMSGGFDGISYAITAADVQAALDQYAKVGNISPAWLGVILQRGGGSSEFGVEVDGVRPESPAAKAGLKGGDLLIGIDGRSVAGDPEIALKALAVTLRHKMPGDAMQLQVYRNGGVVTMTVTLAPPAP
ncbi:MAG: trypsin-like peptidase domain-containing protein [Elusimicrobia bacterium]|nr:trypsin-like peptidase domain-containing protein [Elusimicrobiota bacterium]